MPSSTTKPRILIVNDRTPLRRVLRGFLARWGFSRVDEAADGVSALRWLRLRRYDLVISDGDMRPASGRALLWQIRADPKLHAIPFILLTTSRVRLAATARALGATSCLTKPFDATALKRAVAGILGDGTVPAPA